jgi:hypothetical protein
LFSGGALALVARHHDGQPGGVQTRPNALNNRTLRGLLLALDKPLSKAA